VFKSSQRDGKDDIMKYLAFAALMGATTLQAEGLVSYSSSDSFDDVVFGLENAILNEGLVIDSVSHVGEMLERTRADVGSDVTLYPAADVFSFCSASLSRKVMEADPANIMFCPYDIFVAQMPGEEAVTVGYRAFPDGPMKEVEALLDRIARSAAGLD
jgi:uncharacterized protein (DUF302 family)